MTSEGFIPAVTPFSFFGIARNMGKLPKTIGAPRSPYGSLIGGSFGSQEDERTNARQAKMARMMHVKAVPLSWKTAQLTSASIISAAIHRDIAASSMDGV
jgi:hypothetical protein